MTDRLLVGLGRFMIPVPGMIWHRLVAANARKTRAGLGFMAADHHRVRDYVVTELPRAGAPLPPEAIATALDLPLARVRSVLDELEKRLTFLFRNQHGAVTWAYPVTVDETPHRARFNNGEQAYSP
ncbi:MAG: hypothetical protein HY699_19875 [Deltaproteobacteria bacterium]|nr:hypothetical protein [Deltaproteobacteria bacterium]